MFQQFNDNYLKHVAGRPGSFLSNIVMTDELTFSFDLVLLPFQIFIMPSSFYELMIASQPMDEDIFVYTEQSL